MNDFFPQQSYLDISTSDMLDTITVSDITSSSLTVDSCVDICLPITGSVTAPSYTTTSGTYTLSGIGNITLPDLVTLNWNDIEFEDTMPTLSKVKSMCEEYPALEKAYENFKSIYKLVQDDWASRTTKDE